MSVILVVQIPVYIGYETICILVTFSHLIFSSCGEAHYIYNCSCFIVVYMFFNQFVVLCLHSVPSQCITNLGAKARITMYGSSTWRDYSHYSHNVTRRY